MLTDEMPRLRAGVHDVALVLLDETTGRYHAAYFTAAPFPGGQQPTDSVRLKSRKHHTAGHETLAESEDELRKLAGVLGIPDDSVLTGGAVSWDGSLGVVLLLPTRR